MRYKTGQAGLTLIVSMVMLVVLTLLVVAGMRSSTMSERMAGSSMERARAYQAAEQALAQASAVLQTNGEDCLSGCTNVTASVQGKGVGAAWTGTALPGTWSETNALSITTATGQKTTAKYLIQQLPSSFVPAAKASLGCMAYSVMGLGQGLVSNTQVVLQTVSFVCPL
ncbi:PilX N-terminal domain-containing pilus assembly protein [Uliginosibacterium sp. H3]|uniref:PilX N-terminal domain-containing pilus assembly protein n=1 Tax=Uliginosibacterium silvisoli TaxID=3114758 RepID=A0ABU6K6P0_9RHOO|nr:PilX N-terminal domain-containing pilus assembly protein [Uliginosibacterium sp. H3]